MERSEGGRQQVVPVERAEPAQALELRDAGRRAVHHGDRDRPVQRNHRRAALGEQAVVGVQHGAPVGRLVAGRGRVTGRDPGLEVVGRGAVAGRGALEALEAAPEEGAVPPP